MQEQVVKQVRVGVAVILMRGDKILLGKRQGSHGAGTYSVPGGHLEFGETVGTCAKREVMEETGIAISDPLFQGGFTNDIFAEEGKHYATLFVVSRHNVGVAHNLEPEKCEGWEWYSLDNLPQPLFLPLANWCKNLHLHLSESQKLHA